MPSTTLKLRDASVIVMLMPARDPLFTFSDMFAGIGGMRLAFEGVGGRCVFSSEWDKNAQKTYAANFGEVPRGDIRKIRNDEIPDHQVLLAGFPCQSFSIAGVSKRNSLGMPHGFQDPTQGTLFFEVKRILAAKRPQAFLLENVKHLKTHDRGNTFRVIHDTLTEQLGYDVHYQVLDAKGLVPQHRERIFFVGFDQPTSFEFPRLPDRSPRLEEILDRKVDPKYTLTAHLWKYLQEYREKHRAAGNGFGFGLASPDGITRTLSARYYKDGAEILVPQHGKTPRRLTPRECARLMGFPEKFKIVVSDTQAYKQFGNSVVVPVVQAIAEEMVKHLSGQRKMDRFAVPVPTQ